ncbi:MAG TPA: type III pantothenate kinase [Baekduia sp.]|nr:type III pantothenate kinase [Baekduia sp.]
MLLAVDAGNTQTHFGAFDGDRLVEHWRFATIGSSTADELGAILRNLLELRGIGLADLTASILSSTVPRLEPEWQQVASSYLGHEMLAVGPSIKTGMPIRIDNPRELGADRLVNAIAAYEQLGGPCIAIDFGTALTYDVVSADGDYLGGVIAPGVEVSLDALTSRGSKLSRIDLVEPASAIGKGTVEAIRSGVIYGFAAQVDGLVARLRAELGSKAKTVATGGLARLIVPHCESIDEVDDLLTLTGLRLLHERN